jgi:hypothetical protein
MRNTLAFLGAAALAVAGVGWYLGWYHVFLSPGRGGHETVKIDINTDKVSKDLKTGEEKILHDGKEKLQNLTDTGRDDHRAKQGEDKSTSLLKPPINLLEEQEAIPPPPVPWGGSSLPTK